MKVAAPPRVHTTRYSLHGDITREEVTMREFLRGR